MDGLDLSFTQGATIAALVTVAAMVAAGWQRIRAFLGWVYSYLIVSIQVESSAAVAVHTYLHSGEFKQSRFGNKRYGGMNCFVRPKDQREVIAWERTGQTASVYFKGFRFLWVSIDSDKEGFEKSTVTISFVRWFFNRDQLVLDAVNFLNNLSHSLAGLRKHRHMVRRVYGTLQKGDDKSDEATAKAYMDYTELYKNRLLKWTVNDLGPAMHCEKPTELLALPSDMLEAIEEARRWRLSKKWFQDRGIPWRRGWLLSGEPGTGKTATARAVAEEFDMPVFVYDLASLRNSEFQYEWLSMLSHTPCMALLEDIDAVFEGRKNVAVGENETGLTFDTLINCLDGVEKADGLFLVITTNRVEVLDKALGVPDSSGKSTRPGRVDRSITLTTLDQKGCDKIARRILCDYPDTWNRVVSEGVGSTGAQFQELCIGIALKRFWEGRKSSQLSSTIAARGEKVEEIWYNELSEK